MNIRMLTEADAASFQVIRLRALRDNPEAFGSTYQEAKDRSLVSVAERIHPKGKPPESFVLGAFDSEGRLIGNAGFYRDEGLKRRHKGTIWGMYVVPEARGQSVGKILLQQTIAHASVLPGLEQIDLMVVTTNVAARRLYLSIGFQVYGLERHALKYGNTYWDEELMVLHLAASPIAPQE